MFGSLHSQRDSDQEVVFVSERSARRRSQDITIDQVKVWLVMHFRPHERVCLCWSWFVFTPNAIRGSPLFWQTSKSVIDHKRDAPDLCGRSFPHFDTISATADTGDDDIFKSSTKASLSMFPCSWPRSDFLQYCELHHLLQELHFSCTFVSLWSSWMTMEAIL